MRADDGRVCRGSPQPRTGAPAAAPGLVGRRARCVSLGHQFSELEGLQSKDPGFLAGVADAFEEETRPLLSELAALVAPAAQAAAAAAAGVGCGAAAVAAVPAAAPAGDACAAALRAVLHKLKGSALTLGAATLVAACEASRDAVLAGRPDRLAAPPASRGSLAALTAAAEDVIGAFVVGRLALVGRLAAPTLSQRCPPADTHAHPSSSRPAALHRIAAVSAQLDGLAE